ncbi:tellurite resistance TerB family protein [Pararhizobium mangrovi]|uniref:Co-chaperone DjlA N-terminal domain-containing protein n=1 Tax=Pararhizobium mangrovi TaxID=2590452 RepID=A0A506U5C6_9HYPH|nr:TerB family tellurite resistance protein [Pararhizobium mangrovi]TPW27759.1 hypothetical protein FJU11_11020 [Pararhizobium mangrovi]
MFDRIQAFLRQAAGANSAESAFTRDDPRVAMAALFFHVVNADGEVRESERERLRTILKTEWSLDEAELDRLVVAGRETDAQSVDLYRSSILLKHTLDETHRLGFIELLWEIAYADGVRDELEENVIWRIAELMGVSGRDRVLLRRKVAERAGDTDTGTDTD